MEPYHRRRRLRYDDMRPALTPFLLAGALLLIPQLHAQMHKVAKPEQVVRAVGVYEWTGDLKKPSASRLIPVTVFIDGNLEDAGIYLARPIPFALTPGNEYELQQAGVAHGSLDLTSARHLQTVDTAYEDGWLGYGSYKAPPAPKKESVLRASKTQPAITSSKDDARPHFGGKQTASDTKAGPTQTGKDTQNSTAGQTDDSQNKSTTDDADRPTMHRGAESSTTTPDTSSGNPGTTSANDPDRPTLRRRSPEEDAKKSKKKDVATVTGIGSLNDDPDRPKLQRSARSTDNDTDIPKLIGVPKDLQQMVAVSDPANRPVHDFSRPWENETEHVAVLAKMQALARTQLAAYNASAPTQANPPAAASSPVAPSHLQAAARPNHARARSTKPSPASQQPLIEEQLKAYTLSYGGAPTYIYTAHTSGAGPDLRYVTVVAQADVNGNLQPAVRSVTDELHLDRTPRMRFIDVVDAEASNRASLVFELRSQNERQFALYQVIGARAQTLFTTGTTQ